MNTKLNVKQWAIASLAVFVIMTIFTYIPTKLELAPWAAAVGTPITGDSDMMNRMFFYLARLISAALFTLIFAKGAEGKPGMGEGIRYGLLIGMFSYLPGFFQNFAMGTWAADAVIVFTLVGIVQFVCCGAVMNQLYKPGKA